MTKTQTPLVDWDQVVVPHAGKYSLQAHLSSQLGEAVILISRARTILEEYQRTIGFGEVHREIVATLDDIESFAAERKRCFATGDDWRKGM